MNRRMHEQNSASVQPYVQAEAPAGVAVPATTELAEAKRTIMEVLSEQDVRSLAVSQHIQLRFHEKHGNAMQNANEALRAEQSARGVKGLDDAQR